jgi:hypothetical protein
MTALQRAIRDTQQPLEACGRVSVTVKRELLRRPNQITYSEKNAMTEEAHKLINAIQQMEESLVDEKANGQYSLDNDDLQVTYPLNRCVAFLREQHSAIGKLHRQRFEQVKSTRFPNAPLLKLLTTYRTGRSPRVIFVPPRTLLRYTRASSHSSWIFGCSELRSLSNVRHGPR